NRGVVLEVERATVGQRRAVLQVEHDGGGPLHRAVVRERAGVAEEVAGERDDARRRDGEGAAAVDRAAAPGHGRAGDVDRAAAAQRAARHGEEGDRLRGGAVDGERAAGDVDVAGERATDGAAAARLQVRAGAGDGGC